MNDRESIALLDTEVVRAMSGRPAWRVVAACVKGGPCPRCLRPMQAKCVIQSGSACRERVWAQRARERAEGYRPRRAQAAGAQGFIGVIVRERVAVGAKLWRRPDAEGWHWPDECGTGEVDPAAMDAAIACGLVRLAISGGVMPVWVVTEYAVREAAAWAVEVLNEAAAALPPAPSVDAQAASQALAARMGEA